jgi:L-iditol 2-dehydrogenase
MLGLDQDGAFADHVVLPWRALHAVPATLSPRRAAYTEPVAASLAVLRAPIAPGERGLLLGKNRIAELTLRVLEASGFRGVTCLPHDAPLPDNAFDFAIETVATEASLAGLLRAVRPGGCLVLKSRPAERIPLDIGLAVRRDLRLCAVGYGSFPEAIRLLATLPIDDLLGEVFPLRRFEDAFAMARRSESAKLFLAP